MVNRQKVGLIVVIVSKETNPKFKYKLNIFKPNLHNKIINDRVC
jgi:hypothetical protein